MELSGAFSGKSLITANVSATYDCYLPYVNVVCGGGSRELTAVASFPYQGASVEWED